MNNEQLTTEDIDAPEQQQRPGMEEKPNVRTGSDSDRVPTPADIAAENERLKADIHMRTAVYEIERRLAKAGARSPTLLVEQAKASFQFSEEGELTNAEAVIEHMRATFPEQFAPDPPPSIDASAGRTTQTTLTKEALARMTTAEIQRMDWNEVKTALAQ